jgi:HK97 family phage major capsid protein
VTVNKSEILEALQGIVEGAAERSLTDEEVTRYEELEAQLRAAERDEQVRARQAAYNTVDRSAVAGLVAPAKQDDTLERAFEAFIRSGVPNQDIAELRSQNEGSGPAGGYLVPETFRNKVVEAMRAHGGIAGVAETITTTTGAPLPWVTVDDTANVGSIVQEGDTFSSGADLVFGTASLGAYKYRSNGAGTNALRISLELLQDAAIDIQGLVSRKLGERISRIQATHLATGNGAGQPKGLIHGLTGIEIAADGDGITYNDLVTFIHSIDPAYRSNARWVFNDNTLEIVRKMEDAAGDPLWRPDTSDMATGLGGGTLLGFPVTIDQAMPDFSAANNTQNWGAFGDINRGYVVRRVREITLIVNPWSRADYGEVEFSAWSRMDACPQDTNAYTALTGEA